MKLTVLLRSCFLLFSLGEVLLQIVLEAGVVCYHVHYLQQPLYNVSRLGVLLCSLLLPLIGALEKINMLVLGNKSNTRDRGAICLKNMPK